MTHPISEDDIRSAIDGNNSEVNTDELDDLILAIQEDIEDRWPEFMAFMEEGDIELVAENNESIVFADIDGKFWNSEFDAIMNFTNLLGVEDVAIPETLLSAHHNAAYRLAEHNWSTSNPVVVRKPTDFDRAKLYVEAVVNGLRTKGLSPGQAWAYYGVEIQGNSRNHWAERCGYSDHSAVSGAVRKAAEKLP